MTPRQECAEALRKLADELEGGEPHEVLRLAALAHWRLNEAVNTLPEPDPFSSTNPNNAPHLDQ